MEIAYRDGLLLAHLYFAVPLSLDLSLGLLLLLLLLSEETG
jgi:hypothetical protein